MSETVRDLWVTFPGEGATDAMTIAKFLDEYGDLPIVRLDGERVVLDVDREALARAAVKAGSIYEGADFDKLTGKARESVLAGVDAILTKLELREVECLFRVDAERSDGAYLLTMSPTPETANAAWLKPKPTSKEATR
jgi:hypothetical protein